MSTEPSGTTEHPPHQRIEVELRATFAGYPYGDRNGWVRVQKRDNPKGVLLQFGRQTNHRDFRAGKLKPVVKTRMIRGQRVTELLITHEAALELKRGLESLLRGEDSHRDMSLVYRITIPPEEKKAA